MYILIAILHYMNGLSPRLAIPQLELSLQMCQLLLAILVELHLHLVLLSMCYGWLKLCREHSRTPGVGFQLSFLGAFFRGVS